MSECLFRRRIFTGRSLNGCKERIQISECVHPSCREYRRENPGDSVQLRDAFHFQRTRPKTLAAIRHIPEFLQREQKALAVENGQQRFMNRELGESLSPSRNQRACDSIVVEQMVGEPQFVFARWTAVSKNGRLKNATAAKLVRGIKLRCTK